MTTITEQFTSTTTLTTKFIPTIPSTMPFTTHHETTMPPTTAEMTTAEMTTVPIECPLIQKPPLMSLLKETKGESIKIQRNTCTSEQNLDSQPSKLRFIMEVICLLSDVVS